MTAYQTEDLALAEIKHRMSNCFQLITSLIQHRLRLSSSDEARQHLAWLGDTVTALGLLQQRLAASGEQGFADYLADAVGFWNRLGSSQGVRVVMAVEPGLAVPPLRTSSLALIVHEVVSNAMEHAFGDGAGEIAIEFRHVREGLELLVRDDGCGFAPAAARSGSLGLGLVEKLVAQLRGSVEIDGRAGTSVRVVVPI